MVDTTCHSLCNLSSWNRVIPVSIQDRVYLGVTFVVIMMIPHPCSVINDFCGVITNPCRCVAILEAISGCTMRCRLRSLGVCRDIGDCGVDVTPQMFNKVTNHGDMGTFSRPACHLHFEHVNSLCMLSLKQGYHSISSIFGTHFLWNIRQYCILSECVIQP